MELGGWGRGREEYMMELEGTIECGGGGMELEGTIECGGGWSWREGATGAAGAAVFSSLSLSPRLHSSYYVCVFRDIFNKMERNKTRK